MAEGGVGISNATKPEYEALRKSYPTLVECIERSLGTTTDELYSLGVFSKDEVKYLRNDKVSDTEKARKILNVVMSKVESEPSFICEFICIMDIEEWMKPYVKVLKANLEAEQKRNLNSISEHVAEVEGGEATNTDLDTTDFTPAMDIYTYLNDDTQPQFIAEMKFDENELEYRTKEIQDEFASVVTNIAMALEYKGITTSAFTFHLSELESVDTDSVNVKSTENVCYFTDNFVQQVADESQNDIYKVFKPLRRYYSWINWGLIKNIKDTFLKHNEDIQTLWEEYQLHFKNYCKKRMCETKPINGTRIKSKLFQKNTTVAFKVDVKWNEIRFDKVDDIRKCIIRLLGSKFHTLYLSTVKKGCVEFEFEVPQHVADFIFPPSEEQLQALQEHRIKYCGFVSLSDSDETKENIPSCQPFQSKTEQNEEHDKTDTKYTISERSLSLTDFSTLKQEKNVLLKRSLLLTDIPIQTQKGTLLEQSESSNLSTQHSILLRKNAILEQSLSLADLPVLTQDEEVPTLSSENDIIEKWTIAAIGECNTQKHEIINKLLGKESICPTSNEDTATITEIKIKGVNVEDYNNHSLIEHLSTVKELNVDTILYFLPENDYKQALQNIASKCDLNFWERCIILVKMIGPLNNISKIIKETLLEVKIPFKIVDRLQIVTIYKSVQNWFLRLCWTVIGVSLKTSQKHWYIMKILAKKIDPKYKIRSDTLDHSHSLETSSTKMLQEKLTISDKTAGPQEMYPRRLTHKFKRKRTNPLNPIIHPKRLRPIPIRHQMGHERPHLTQRYGSTFQRRFPTSHQEKILTITKPEKFFESILFELQEARAKIEKMLLKKERTKPSESILSTDYSFASPLSTIVKEEMWKLGKEDEDILTKTDYAL